ncbi:class I adenylate-forming enzyme family protein [Vallitalea sp.]|jgi:acyl-CoA synthetase (AMP-forming)/AMP-acid ligase II|uniref:class I adenylate-forming enzyme family protein n=1 Tax=Vallitalea sp. TaxID=1882829 RepID=UPI0025F286AC|nr:class I adenylate-forming enzyme family protein [Vallitalea sp.]MCT4688880.1 acyl--CoA ligase [Vallitalea sp.]
MLYKCLIEDNLRDNADKIALRYHQYNYKYSDLHNFTMGLKESLSIKGIKKGDRVIIISKNSPMEVIAILATISLGVVFVPLPYDISEKRLDYVVKDCEPAAILVDEERYSQLDQGHYKQQVILLSDDVIPNTDGPYHREILDRDDLAYIIYTSGSTSQPKGVVACQRQVLFAAKAINEALKNTKEDILLCRIPLSFDYGLYQVLMSFMIGAELILIDEKELVQNIPYLLKKYNVTAFPVVPALINMLVKSKLLERIELPNLRYMSSTGDVLPTYIINKLDEIMPHVEVIPMYGLTECKRVSVMPYGDKEKKLEGSCGIPLPGTEVKLLNKKDGVGELAVMGPHVMCGYWGDIEETSKYYTYYNGRAMLKTGDLFKIDNEGYLYFVGRTKSFIKNNGYRVNVLELETILNSQEKVREVAVIGIENVDIGEEIVCILSVNDLIDKDSIIKESKKLLSGIKVKKYIVTKELLPKNSNGKINRKILKEQIKSK